MKKHFGKFSAIFLAVVLLVSLFSASALAVTTSLPDSVSERVLNIYKYSPIPEDGTAGDGTEATVPDGSIPLENVEFEIYKVPAEMEVNVTTPNAIMIRRIAIEANLVDTIATDEDGMATYSFGTGTANDGTYLIIEKSNPAVETPAAPFFVSIPYTNPAEDGWLYTVNVYPKNDLEPGPEVNKDVTAIDNDTETKDIGDTETWIIRGDVPSDLWYQDADGADVYAKNYEFVDDLSTALDYKGNVSVKLYTKDDTEVELTNATHYTVTAPTSTSGGTLKVALTDVGKKFVMENLGTGDNAAEIRVYFDTAINDTAALATEIPNDVTLNYTNSTGTEYEPVTVPPEDIPEVHTGGLLVYKVDNVNGLDLQGAKFKIARAATDKEIAAGTGVETITVNNTDIKVVFVDFYDTDAIEDARVTEVTTDTDGYARINGLAYGNYYLIETKAPDGYNLLSAPVEVTVSETSHLVANAVEVNNTAKFVLPITGGNGTVLFTAGGVLLIGLAAILIVASRKKKHTAE